jgi:hypothetical protein
MKVTGILGKIRPLPGKLGTFRDTNFYVSA